jgi:hypothetical protein
VNPEGTTALDYATTGAAFAVYRGVTKLPASGQYSGVNLSNLGSVGVYWSSSVSSGYRVDELYFMDERIFLPGTTSVPQNGAHTIRCVKN